MDLLVVPGCLQSQTALQQSVRQLRGALDSPPKQGCRQAADAWLHGTQENDPIGRQQVPVQRAESVAKAKRRTVGLARQGHGLGGEGHPGAELFERVEAEIRDADVADGRPPGSPWVAASSRNGAPDADNVQVWLTSSTS